MENNDLPFSFDDLGFGNRFVFVPRDQSTTITATDVLNPVTFQYPPVPDTFAHPFDVPDPDDRYTFNPPVVESVNNGDDIFVRFTSKDNAVVLEVFANADGSEMELTIRYQLLDPADFANLFAPDPKRNLVVDFAVFGFVPQDPFAGVDLTQGLDRLSFDGLTVGDTGFFDSPV
jgi:hypothetical protein